MRAAFAAAVAAPQRTATTEGRLRHRDGSWRWFEAITTNHLDEPTIGGIVLNARDISERKRLPECGDADGAAVPRPRSRRRNGRAARESAADPGQDDVAHQGDVRDGVATLGQ